MPGFLAFVDPSSPFGGVASNCLELFRDEYPKAIVVSFATEEPFESTKLDINESSIRDLNQTLSIAVFLSFFIFSRRLLHFLLFIFHYL